MVAVEIFSHENTKPPVVPPIDLKVGVVGFATLLTLVSGLSVAGNTATTRVAARLSFIANVGELAAVRADGRPNDVAECLEQTGA